MEEMNRVDKEALMGKLTDNLEGILMKTGLDAEVLGRMTGIDMSRVKGIASGTVRIKWSEYLSVVFVLWNSRGGKRILEDYGLFPPELQAAFSVDRKEHPPDIGRIHL